MYHHCDKCRKETEHTLESPAEGVAPSYKSGAAFTSDEFIDLIKSKALGTYFKPPEGVTSTWKCNRCGSVFHRVERVDTPPEDHPVRLRDLR